MRVKQDLTGREFGRLAVVELRDYRKYLWLCRCSCGNEKVIQYAGWPSGKRLAVREGADNPHTGDGELV